MPQSISGSLRVETDARRCTGAAPQMPSADGPIVTSSEDARRAPLVLGLGCERHATSEEVIALAEQALVNAGAGAADLAFIASLDARAQEPALHATALHFSVPLRFFDAATLETVADRLQNPSQVVFAHTGCHGVAEGAALVGAGQDASLVVPKMRSARATAAIAGPSCFSGEDRVTTTVAGGLFVERFQRFVSVSGESESSASQADSGVMPCPVGSERQ